MLNELLGVIRYEDAKDRVVWIANHYDTFPDCCGLVANYVGLKPITTDAGFLYTA